MNTEHTAETRKIYQVAELTHRMKAVLDDAFGFVWIEGEISGIRRPSSGHIYFTLKDERAQIQAVLFRGNQRGLDFELEDGLKVHAYGQVTIYEQRSQYQVIVRRIEQAGRGSLQEAFEKLKQKLQAEGLFDEAQKKPLPVLPRKIGVVTSPTGAAVRDILNVIARRFPNLHILIAPASVQGEKAPAEIAEAIALLNERDDIDVMIVGRGGGSLEDLWSFNEEVVARAIYTSRIPVISAVGHETDFTISDFVADLRAPTPSAGAELVIGRKEAFEEQLRGLARGLVEALDRRRLELKNRYVAASRSYVFREPANIVDRARRQLEGLQTRMRHQLVGELNRIQQQLDEFSLRATHHVKTACATRRQDLRRLSAQLAAFNPHAVLQRGYSVTRTADGTILRTTKDVRKGDPIVTQLAKGTLESEVKKTSSEEEE